jgi:hypothetical protein
MKPISTLLFATAIASVALPAAAQPTAPLGAARVTLIAGKSPSKGARTEVVRQAQRSPQNVVLVDRNANADDLGAALAMVNGLRVQHGDALVSDFRARPEHVKHGSKWKDSEYRKWLHDQLVRLRKAPDRELQPFGTVKSVQVTLPAPTGTISAGDRKK